MSKNLNRHFSKDIYKWHISTWKKTNCGKFLKIWEYQDNLTCLLRNLYSGQEATVRTGHRTDWLQIRKGVHQACILSLCLFNLHAEYIMQNTRLDEAQAGIKIRWWLQPWNSKMLALWKKSYDQPRQNIKKQRHYFANKGPFSQSYGFLIVMCGCESWIIKKAEHWRIDAFELWCWRRLLRDPWNTSHS